MKLISLKWKRDKIKEFIEGLLNKYRLDIEERKINLTINMEDGIIIEDLGKLSIILNNLLTNAITYRLQRIIEIAIKIKFKDFK